MVKSVTIRHGGMCLGAALLLAAGRASAVEIPVHQGSDGGTRVGFVDMESVYRDYPDTRRAREDYQKEVARHKRELGERDRALQDLRGEINVLRSSATLSTPMAGEFDSSASSGTWVGPVSTSTSTPALEVVPATSTVPAVSEALIQRLEKLVQREAEFEEAQASSEKALKVFESERSQKILGRLYKALVDVAQEKGVDLVVDKSSILYGRPAVDLTEALNRRIRGLPETEK